MNRYLSLICLTMCAAPLAIQAAASSSADINDPYRDLGARQSHKHGGMPYFTDCCTGKTPAQVITDFFDEWSQDGADSTLFTDIPARQRSADRSLYLAGMGCPFNTGTEQDKQNIAAAIAGYKRNSTSGTVFDIKLRMGRWFGPIVLRLLAQQRYQEASVINQLLVQCKVLWTSYALDAWDIKDIQDALVAGGKFSVEEAELCAWLLRLQPGPKRRDTMSPSEYAKAAAVFEAGKGDNTSRHKMIKIARFIYYTFHMNSNTGTFSAEKSQREYQAVGRAHKEVEGLCNWIADCIKNQVIAGGSGNPELGTYRR